MKRLCLFAGFDKNNIVQDYVIYYLKNLAEFAEIHYMADCEMPACELEKLAPYVKSAHAFRHGKYDFGSWQELIYTLGWDYLEQFDEVIVANDSCFAPVFPFGEMFNEMERKNLDFWGNTINIYAYRHIQSYFIVFNNKVICDDTFRYFFEDIKQEDERYNVVHKYEKRLTGLLENKGYKYDVYVDKKLVATKSYYRLLKAHSPFMKVKHYTDLSLPVPASYLSLLILKILGYPSEYVLKYLNKNYSRWLLLKNALLWMKFCFYTKPRRIIRHFVPILKNYTVLITGGAGFIGSSLADNLLSRGYKVIVVDNFDDFYPRELKQKNVANNLNNKRYKLYEEDINDFDAMEKIFGENKIDFVYHLAAKANVRKSFENPEAYFETNVNGTENILKCCVKYKVKKFIATSSSSVYGAADDEKFSEDMENLQPISPYAESKLKMEALIKEYSDKYNLKSVIVRPFTVFGPRQRPDLAICKFIRKISADEPIDVYGDGSSSRDYTYISDMVFGLFRCMRFETGHFQIINIGSSEPVTLTGMINVIEQCLGKKAKINRLPNQKGDVPRTYADISKARKLFRYSPAVSFKQGIEKFIEYML